MPPVLIPTEVAAGPLLLTAATEGDIPALVAAFADPDINLWNGARPHVGDSPESMVRDWVDRRRDWSSGEHASWMITEQGQLVGAVSVFSIDHVGSDAQIGYWVAPRARGRHVARLAVAAASNWAFDTLEIFRIELFHAVENLASCRVATACGFALEGTTRQSYTYGDGLRHDEHMHARLASDRNNFPAANAD